MIVRCWMTSHPLVVADENMTLQEALQLMQNHGVRRLPVVDGCELKGIIALSDLYAFAPPAALGQGLAEVSAELGHRLVRDRMTTKVFTCDANSPLEDAGALMRQEKVGALPVMNGKKLVGIITESDVLDALVSITRAGDEPRSIYLRIPRDQGYNIFKEIVEICREYGVEIYTLLTHPIRNSDGRLVMLKFSGARAKDFIQALWSSDYQVLISDVRE